MRHAWLALVLLACDSGSAGAGPAEPWAYAVAEPSCAPWDGAATAVVLSTSPLDSLNTPPHLSLLLYQGPEAARGHRFEVGATGTAGAGASYCPPVGDCTWATAGEVRVSGAGGMFAGSYDLIFADGSHQSGRFTAPLRERQALCG